jgi:ATP-dependent Lon protease
MGRSLNELMDVGYLSKWDIKPMATKEGYKLILLPGEELLHVLAISQRKQIAEQNEIEPDLPESQQAAIKVLLEKGVSPAKARTLVRQYVPDMIMDQIEYTDFLMSRDRRQTFDNPAGFIIYTIENQIPVPISFTTSRRLREQQAKAQQHLARESQIAELQIKYEEWIETQVEETIAKQHAGFALKQKIKDIISKRLRTDDRFNKMAVQHQESLAMQFLRKDTRDELQFPSLEQWCEATQQLKLF